MFRTLIAAGLIAGMLQAPAFAQEDYDYEMEMEADGAAGDNLYGPEQGDLELTLGGGGRTDDSISSTDFSLNGSLGYFFTDAWEVVVRQDIGFSDVGNSAWIGGTRVALDYHFDANRLRPFVGVNVGGVYGDGIDDRMAAGLEGGAKYYVRPKTFIFGLLQYQFFFENSDDANDAFDDGEFVYNFGVGFNF